MTAQDYSGTLIPARMRRLPRFHGMPIPYSTWIHPVSGVPDFKVNDESRRLRCIAKRRCAMCGETMNQEIAFIGGPGSIEQSQLFMDAGMHPACAFFAWKVCPYIVLGRGHAKTHKVDPRAALVVHAGIPTEPPERMGLMLTRSYSVVRQSDSVYVKAGPAESVIWRTYERSAP